MGECPHKADWENAKIRKDGKPNMTCVKGEAQSIAQIIRNVGNTGKKK